MSVAQMSASLYILNNGDLDDVESEKICAFESAFQAYLKSNAAELMAAFDATPTLTDEVAAGLDKAVAEFKANGTY
jgi:F-type H+-transporting ATPase subunit alpha